MRSELFMSLPGNYLRPLTSGGSDRRFGSRRAAREKRAEPGFRSAVDISQFGGEPAPAKIAHRATVVENAIHNPANDPGTVIDDRGDILPSADPKRARVSAGIGVPGRFGPSVTQDELQGECGPWW